MGLYHQPHRHDPGSWRALQLLAWAFPLVTFASFADDTLERAPKSEGYCSRILRAQGTRREGYNEFSLRVEGDPEFYKPGNSYRAMDISNYFKKQKTANESQIYTEDTPSSDIMHVAFNVSASKETKNVQVQAAAGHENIPTENTEAATSTV